MFSYPLPSLTPITWACGVYLKNDVDDGHDTPQAQVIGVNDGSRYTNEIGHEFHYFIWLNFKLQQKDEFFAFWTI